MLLFLCKNDKELFEVKNTIESVAREGLLKDTIVVVSEASFKEKNLNKFLEFKAKSEVAKKYNYEEDEKVHNDGAKKLADEWAKNIRSGMIYWYVNKNEGNSSLSEFSNTINEKISREIFYKGLENIDLVRSNKTIWTKKQAKTQAEHYLNSRSYEELSSKLHSRFLLIMKDNNSDLIVNSNLQLNNNVQNNHPIKLLQNFVDEQFKKAQRKGKFNLGKELEPLTKPPYGLYPSEINIAALSFVMRKYVNKIYDEKGLPIIPTQMKEKVLDTFMYWDKNKKEEKLYVRFGSEEEKALIKLLIDVFDLDITESEYTINNARWKIKEWIKENKFPLWLLDYSENITPSLKDSIKKLSELLRPEDGAIPDEIIQNCYDAIKINKFDLHVLIKSDKKELIEKYINDTEPKISSENIAKVREHVLDTMPEEIHSWKKTDVTQEIYKWYIDYIEDNQEPEPPKIILNVKTNENDQTVLATLNINNDATGTVDFYINDEKKGTKQVTNGKAEFQKRDLAEGSYMIRAQYNGCNKYTSEQSMPKVFTIKLQGTIDIAGRSFNSDEDAFVTIKTNKQTSVNVYVDGEKQGKYTAPISKLKVDLGKLNAGIHKIYVEYDNDKNINAETTVEIIQKPPKPCENLISRIKQENAENVKNITIELLKENKEFREAYAKMLKE